jgi:RNA polymerase sigma-70 factor (sigma-E family)
MGLRTSTRADQQSAAFREFVQQRAAPLHRSAYLLCGDTHLAEDLVQETFAKAYAQWHRVQSAGNPEAYVRRILLNEARSRWRRHDVPVPRTDDAHRDQPVADWSDDLVRRAELLEALLRLPLKQRATIVLRYLDGMSEHETAMALNCSVGTVKSHASRALASLRKYLGRQETNA